MKIGLIARGENRGIGHVTQEFARHLQPTKVLGVEMAGASPYPNHWHRFSGAEMRLAMLDPHGDINGAALPREDLEWLVDGVDVVYMDETPYDYALFDIARRARTRTVLHINPELLRWVEYPDLPRPDLFWSKTSWRADEVFAAIGPTRLVPVPVARDRLTYVPRDEARTFLHVAGHRAKADRNGTHAVAQAAHYLRGELPIILRGQSPLAVSRDYLVEQVDIPNYADLYRGADVAVLPRRYGGSSLPMNEAAACGMPVITLDVCPQAEWFPAEALIPVNGERAMAMQGGLISVAKFDPLLLASKMQELARDRELVGLLSKASDAYAESISWDRMAPIYRKELAR